MCNWGDTIPLQVVICAEDSHTGKMYTAVKKIDRCIAPLVDALNSAGILTRSSCCGHGKFPGEIWLQDGRKLIIKEPKDE